MLEADGSISRQKEDKKDICCIPMPDQELPNALFTVLCVDSYRIPFSTEEYIEAQFK